MPKILEKIKNFFSARFIYKPKRREESLAKPAQPQTDKTEGKPEEKKQ